MSLKKARQIVTRLRKAGILAGIHSDRAACLAHNPAHHFMAGTCVVRETGIALGQMAPRMFWE